jgi:hypothetical protein
MSPSQKPYIVGGISTTLKWYTTYIDCQQHFSSFYGADFTPVRIRTMLLEPNELVEIVKRKINSASTILDVLLIHSAIINTYGIIQSQPTIDSPQQLINICTVYDSLYDETKKILKNLEHINVFVTKEQFKTLNNDKSERPVNLYLKEGGKGLVEKYQLTTTNNLSYEHPITQNMRKCGVGLNDTCLKNFEKITNPLFKPLAEFIVCACSFFKQPVSENIRNNDIQMFRKEHHFIDHYKFTPIVIKKVEGTYLSQLFEKCVNILYKPVFVTSEINTKEAFMKASSQNQELLIARVKGLDTYADPNINKNNLHVFQSAIIKKGAEHESGAPVYFIESGNINLKNSSKDSIEFFKGVIDELFKHKVFIRNGKRYELNKNFDIEKLDFYKELPTGVKTDEEIMKKLKKHFYRFVGNIIHFAVANNFELPFRLSRIYIMQLFNLFDFRHITAANRLQTQLLFVGTYLIEHATFDFTKAILQIFEDPKMLLSEDVIAVLDPTLTGSARRKGVRVEGVHIYDDTDQEKMFNNMITFLYKYISSKVFKSHTNAFFEGFKTIRHFESTNTKVYDMMVFNIPLNSKYEDRLKYVNRADIFLSGPYDK